MKRILVVIFAFIMSIGLIQVTVPVSPHSIALGIQLTAAQTKLDKSPFLNEKNTSPAYVDNKILSINEVKIKGTAAGDSGWIELYNSSTSPVNLKGYYLSNDTANLKKWQFPEALIGPGELLLISLLPKQADASPKVLQTNFEISPNDKAIVLAKPDGITIEDQITMVSIPEGQSLGHFPDGSKNLKLFEHPTRDKSNNNNIPANIPGKAGIAITWDDDAVDEWHKLLSFKWYQDIKTTFGLTHPFRLNEDKWEKLRDLKRHGHEIASHAYNHENALHYVKSSGMQAYIDNEILTSVNLMTLKGLAPVSFIYPYGAYNNATNSALLNYFKTVRITSYSAGGDPFKWGTTKVLPANGMDSNYPYTMEDYYKWLEKAKNTNQVVILYGHTPTAELSGNYRTPHQRLELIIKKAKELNLTFYTLSELSADIGTLAVDIPDSQKGRLEWTLDRKTWYSQSTTITLPPGEYSVMVRSAEKHDIKTIKIVHAKTTVIKLTN